MMAYEFNKDVDPNKMHNQCADCIYLFFYIFPEHGSCHGICQRMQLLHVINLQYSMKYIRNTFYLFQTSLYIAIIY